MAKNRPIKQWMYYMWNFETKTYIDKRTAQRVSAPNCFDAFDPQMRDHHLKEWIRSIQKTGEWSGTDTLLRFYFTLSANQQIVLEEWVCKNYV